MSYKERNTTVSLVIAILILLYFRVRFAIMLNAGPLVDTQVFRLWVTVIIMAIGANILMSIIASIVYGIIYKIRYPDDEPEFTEDERDELIDLKGTRVSYIFHSLGVLVAMITFATGRPPLVMFTVIIGSGQVAQIIGDLWRLYRYRRGV